MNDPGNYCCGRASRGEDCSCVSCPACNGDGERLLRMGGESFWRPCRACGGPGMMPPDAADDAARLLDEEYDNWLETVAESASWGTR